MLWKEIRPTVKGRKPTFWWLWDNGLNVNESVWATSCYKTRCARRAQDMYSTSITTALDGLSAPSDLSNVIERVGGASVRTDGAWGASALT